MKKFRLSLSPGSEIAKFVAAATPKVKQEQEADEFIYTYFPPELCGTIKLTGVAQRHSAALTSGILIEVEPADCILTKDGFTSYLGALGVSALMPAIHAAVAACLSLDHDDLPALDLKDLVVERTVSEFFFAVGSPTEAVSRVLKLVEHCKIIGDMARPMPDRKWKYKTRKITVNWSSMSPFSAEMQLPFGAARFSVLVDGRAAPAKARDVGDEDHLSAIGEMRCMVCVEIDAEMALVTKGDDPSFRLPLQLDRWSPQAMRTNPYQFLWSAFEWATWLNLDLIRDEGDINDDVRLSDEQADVLAAYFNGENLRNHPAINDDYARFLAFRKALIVGARVDLLNSWRYFRLNSAAELREQFAFDKKVKPEDAPTMAQYTLTADLAEAAKNKLTQALKEDPGRGVFQ